MPEHPRIVCISGSMKFEDEMRLAAVEESIAGHIVVMPHVNMKRPLPVTLQATVTEDDLKTNLDQLHFGKIRLADEVLVVTRDGYIGDSTKHEIAYAESIGKPVRYWLEHECPVPEPTVTKNKGTEYTEFTVRWTMDLGRPMFGVWGSRGLAMMQLREPRAGAISGELVQRTITTSPWTAVPDVPAVQGLFAQPEHDHSALPGFPEELVKSTSHHNGLRYTSIGDDGDTLVILGHPPRTELDALPTWLGFDPNYEPEVTYARLLFACPDHKPAAAVDDCRFCHEIEPGTWWLDWGTGENAKAYASKPGYFPVVVWEVDA